MNSAATEFEEWSRASLAPGKRLCRVLDARGTILLEDKKIALGYPAYVWRYLLGKKVVAIVGICPIHFDIRFDAMDFNAAKLRDAVIWKIGTSVFNKVVGWYESGEVENLYIAWNFSHFSIYLPKVIKIGGKFDEVTTKTILHLFYWDTVYIIYII